MLTDLHNAIETHLRESFESVPSCRKYPRLRRKITVPAILLELAEMKPDTDAGTGQLCLSARFRAYCIYDLVEDEAELQAANLAASVAYEIFTGGRFGLTVGPAAIASVEPADFKPDLFGYAAWAVEWSHQIRLGQSIWTDAGLTPTDLYIGFAPEIGPGHEPDYFKVGGDE